MRYAERRTRAEARRDKPIEERAWLLEEDMDEKDRQYEGLRQELRNTNKILTGLLATSASAAIVGALNILFKAV